MRLTKKPNIFKYHDHIQLLKDWLQYLKKTDPEFSMRQLSKNAKIASGYLPMVLSKKRELTATALFKVISFLKLNTNEKKYLIHLHKIGTSRLAQEREFHLKKIQKIKDYKDVNTNEYRTHKYLTNWLNVAIREMVSLQDFNVDVSWIQSRLKYKVSQQEIIQALNFLIEHNFIKQDENKKWVRCQGHLDCQEGVYKISLGEFHKKMMDLSKESIHLTDRNERYIKGHTVSMGASDYEKICEILNKSVQSIESIEQNQIQNQEVYHLEISLFPLTSNGLNNGKNEG